MPKNEGPKPTPTPGAYRPANRIQEVTRPRSGSEAAERARQQSAANKSGKGGCGK